MDPCTRRDAVARVGVVIVQVSDGEHRGKLTVNEEANSVDYTREGNEKMSFVFDAVTNQHSIQRLYPELLQPLCELVCSGYHGAVLVGGTLRSGKEKLLQTQSVITQLLNGLFNEITKINTGEMFTTASFIQFYPDDSAVDLLNPEGRGLKPRTHPAFGPYVEGVCEVAVESLEEILSLYEEGRETLSANSGALVGRCSSLFSVNVERRLQGDEAAEQQYQHSTLRVFDLAGGARKGDLNGVSTLVKVMEHIESHTTADDKLLPLILADTLTGSCANVLLYCVQPQDLLDEETSHALALAQHVRGLVTHMVPSRWCPQRATQEIRERIQELQTRMVSQAENEEEDIRKLETLIQHLQVAKNQDWVKKRIQSREIWEKRKSLKEQQSNVAMLNHNADIQGSTERLKQLQTQLRVQIEAHIKDGKVSVDKSQERLGHIQKLREAIKEEEARLKAANGDSEQPGSQTNQAEDGSTQMSEVEVEYSKAQGRRQMLMEDHRAMIQKELDKMERELGEEKADGLEERLLRMNMERQVLVLQLEALRREKLEAEKDLEAQHRRHTQELHTLREEGLQVFRVYRQVFEEQKEMLEDRYRSLLQDAIQDAVYLSAKSQQLQTENKRLHAVLAELRDTISARADPAGWRGHGRSGGARPSKKEEESDRR
ncbi:kinesin-like protein unc-104 [Brienomyrus brachyistius]|uniref:kinesin-like protein unc-104 n=1 Tax=Brienomyrus brachyistius TaxID=42636 RepID=UPI0020B43834|nr:kinesin-like protein unc-104 [Brienomyrus brachyistius]